MADKSVVDLASVSAINDNLALVVEDNGEAKKTTVGDLSDYVQEQLAGQNKSFLIIIRTNGTITESQSIASIANAAQLGIPVYLFVANVSSGNSYNVSEYELTEVRYYPYNQSNSYAHFRKPSGIINDSYYSLDAYGTLTYVNNSDSATFNKNVTISSPNHLTLGSPPSEDNHAATKKYVDDAISAFSGAVSSVNNQTGDVTINIPQMSADSSDNGKSYVINYTYGSTIYAVPVASVYAYPLILHYDTATEAFDGTYSTISAAYSMGREIIVRITCGNSVFSTRLDRYHEAQGQNAYYSFGYNLHDIYSGDCWFGELLVFSDDTVDYADGNYQVTVSQ